MALYENRTIEQRRKALLAAYSMAVVDGILDEREIVALNKIALRHGCTEKDIVDCVENPESIGFEIPASRVDRAHTLIDLYLVLVADGKVADEEKTLYRNVLLVYEFTHDEIENLMRRVKDGESPDVVAASLS